MGQSLEKYVLSQKQPKTNNTHITDSSFHDQQRDNWDLHVDVSPTATNSHNKVTNPALNDILPPFSTRSIS